MSLLSELAAFNPQTENHMNFSTVKHSILQGYFKYPELEGEMFKYNSTERIWGLMTP